MNSETTFSQYFLEWMTLYKKDAVRPVTYKKYINVQQQIEKLAPDLKVKDLNRLSYQKLINDYALTHERQTVIDFHHHLKGSIIDAIDEGFLERDPTRKVIIKGKDPRPKKIKFLNQFELQALLNDLTLENEVNWDYFLLLIAKTGMRFAEALAVTPNDFDFKNQVLNITKTWNYKDENGGFAKTKNESSIRKIAIDWKTAMQFSVLLKDLPENEPIFVKNKRVFNDTINHYLDRKCKALSISSISIHGLRHTHASLLLYAGVSVISVARRLGHSNVTTTQQTYLHIIQELENQDNDIVMRHLSSLA